MAIPRPPEAATFDCWSTLLVDLDSEAAARARTAHLQDVAGRAGVGLDPERAREILEGSWHEHLAAWRRGELFGPDGAARWCLARLGLDVGDDLATELAEAIAGAPPGRAPSWSRAQPRPWRPSAGPASGPP